LSARADPAQAKNPAIASVENLRIRIHFFVREHLTEIVTLISGASVSKLSNLYSMKYPKRHIKFYFS